VPAFAVPAFAVPAGASVVAPAAGPVANAAASRPRATGSQTGQTIMVVEDDPAIREMLVRSLGLEYQVYEAQDGHAALETLAQIELPDLLIADVMMPRMDGLTLARALKAEARTRAIPIIFLTGLDSAKDVVQGINAGARHYLTKPFKIQDLLSKVGKTLGQKPSKKG
jgi:CheY-like chemotaxis protein